MAIEDIEAAWEAVWEDSRITAFTNKILTYEYTDNSEAEINKLSYRGKINFIEAVTERQVTGRLIGGSNDVVPQTYSVDVRYSIERDTSGNKYRDIISFFETLSTVVDEILGSTWDGEVLYYTEQSDPIRIENANIAGVKCWRTIYRFLGHVDGPI